MSAGFVSCFFYPMTNTIQAEQKGDYTAIDATGKRQIM